MKKNVFQAVCIIIDTALEGGCMPNKLVEHLPYRGESASDVFAYQRYRAEIGERGKSLLQLLAVQKDVTPEIRRSWAPQTFTPVQTSEGVFDEVICNISYHFNEHGGKYGSIAKYTHAAQRTLQAESELGATLRWAHEVAERFV